jgi:DNA-binding PadR family transcriptional regulator
LSSDPPLSPTSYIVLGLLAAAGASTPYALKQGVAGSIGHFWSVPHSQLYAEPERLARAGLVTEEREPGGRRRRVYAITERGREALAGWLTDGGTRLPELRDDGLLKLFFGADPRTVAPSQAAGHRERLELYRRLHEGLSAVDDPAANGARLTLEAGIICTRAWVTFWEGLEGGG